MPITVPRNPQIINAACDSAAWPSHALSAVAGRNTPRRSRPPAMPVTSDSATSATSMGRATRATQAGEASREVGARARAAFTSP